jgi:phosphoribosyl 1,2-cyclic phosphate phosphodiesterase
MAEGHAPIRVRALGTGTSMGVPVVGCDCAVCRSEDPLNKRLRSSVSIEVGGRCLLVDVSIDFRQQMLNWPLKRIDAVLLTHCHSDHINGLDDLRSYNYLQRGPIPLYSTRVFLDDIRTRFGYAFNPAQKGGGVPKLDLREITPGTAFEAAPGVEALPVEIMHGELRILGFRVGAFAYLTDCSGIPEAAERQLAGVDTIVISALRHTPHPTHFNVEQSLAACRRLGVRRAWFTHIADELDHRTANAELPDWAQLMHDGQLIEVDGGRAPEVDVDEPAVEGADGQAVEGADGQAVEGGR